MIYLSAVISIINSYNNISNVEKWILDLCIYLFLSKKNFVKLLFVILFADFWNMKKKTTKFFSVSQFIRKMTIPQVTVPNANEVERNRIESISR